MGSVTVTQETVLRADSSALIKHMLWIKLTDQVLNKNHRIPISFHTKLGKLLNY